MTLPPPSPTGRTATSRRSGCSRPASSIPASMVSRCAWLAWSRASTTRAKNAPSSCIPLPTPIPGWFPGSVAWACQGCPAVRPAVAARLINTLKRGSYVFAYYRNRVAGDLALPRPAELRRGTCGAYAGSHRQPAQMNRRGAATPSLSFPHPEIAASVLASRHFVGFQPPSPSKSETGLAVRHAGCNDAHVVTDQSQTTSRKPA